VQRVAHLLAVVTVAPPPVAVPTRTPEGLIDIPGSMVYFPAHGLRRLVPVSWRVRRALKGLGAAVRQRRVFHLWMHPTNLVDEMEAMFGGLRQILEYASRLRAKGSLDVMPMAVLASIATARKVAG
jgi:hypothetical protein